MPPSWPLESRDIVCEESSEHGPVTVTVRPAAVNEYLRGRPNKISTTRFSLLTWLPKSLFIQFQRVANVYFLIVSILVCLPFSPVMWASTALPFCGVLLWTALKDLYEDRKRQRDDDEMNLQTCLRFDLRTKKFVPIKYQEVLVGDFILSFAEDSFPADMMVLAADGGQAFISTMSLDGETNLKERRAPALCSAVTSCKIASGTAYFGKMGTASTIDIGVASQVLEVDAAHLEADEADRIRRFSYNEKACDSQEMRLVRKPSQEDMRAHAKLEAEALAAAFVLRQGLEVKLDMPKVAISEFNGSVSLTAATPAAKRRMAQLKVAEESFLSSENFVPRGCKLQQTVWLLSVVAYTGPESKVWMNSAEVEAKTSNLQVALNRCVLGLVVTLFVFCLYSASMGQAIGEDAGADFPKRFVIYWIILYQIVPISLYVVFEMVKLLLGIAINRDPDMVDPTTGVHAVARTTDLVEEMGQVEHIFSDKTGTLTQNEMRFARCYIRGKDPGDFRPGFKEEETRAAPVGGHEGFASGLLPCGVLESQKILRDSRNPHCQDFLAFFLCLAVCSDVQVEYEGEGTKPKYEGSSADEVAFLEASHEAGVSLQARVAMPGSSGAELEIKRPDGSCQAAKILCTLPFDSDRKRMTVVCEYEGGLLCVTKGADMVMAPLCSGIDEDVWDQLKAYSNLGLRTLVIAHKALDRAEFEEWQLEYESARNASSADRDRLMTECSAKMEHSLKLAGITALEDRLQDGVPEAIATLKAMGIQIWMLTGDKTETAIEIASQCSLLLKDQKLIKLVDAKSDEDCIAMLQAAHAHLCSKANEGEALVMDGAFLLRVSRIAEGDAATAVPKSLMPHMSKSAEREAEAKLLAAGEWQMLVELATSASACVCCRLSPRQKRSLVEMVKHRGGGRTITLAIGDGANDVAMIQGAHVGVAVRGREGTQASSPDDRSG
ncbi:unnamed protein product [Polarella glacialis]|uniref:Phospholipid-transporting ATPase n=1 Tax=Polarella glacialis TaxID=89957 RepID=A0A813I1E4_POLGL|nr:unnamed protein product [Polarella glacialis]